MFNRILSRHAISACFGMASLATSVAAQQPPPDCGAFNREPAFDGGLRERPCEDGQTRGYRPRHSGLAYEILDLESEACFVPDAAYELLDAILDEVIARVRAQGLATNTPSRQLALTISGITSTVLRDRGFGLHIPTRTLGDSLLVRAPGLPGGPVHIFDCDIGSIILLTVAGHYALPASLVDVRLASGKGHNYVRWDTGQNTALDWDMNEASDCRSLPDPQRPWLARSMTHDEVLSHVLWIRGGTWSRRGLSARALPDYRRAMELGPLRPDPFNEFAWLVASRIVPNRSQYEDQALAAAEHAVELERTPGNLDTLACVHALRGEFGPAVLIQTEAMTSAPPDRRADYSERLGRFRDYRAHYDCTGS